MRETEPLCRSEITRKQSSAGHRSLTLELSPLLVFVLPCSASTQEVVGDPSDDNDEQHTDPDGAVPPVAARGSEHHPGDSNGRLSHQSSLLMSSRDRFPRTQADRISVELCATTSRRRVREITREQSRTTE